MDRLRKAALLTRLVEIMRERGSWTGETHIQKATYLLQELLKVPLGFEFILYWHGPFSFELRDELTALRGDELLRLEPQMRPYGPRYAVTEQARYIQSFYPKTLEKYESHLQFVADRLGVKGVTSLERLATALYVTKKLADALVDKKAMEFVRLKPYVSSEDAHAAISEVDAIIGEAHSLVH